MDRTAQRAGVELDTMDGRNDGSVPRLATRNASGGWWKMEGRGDIDSGGAHAAALHGTHANMRVRGARKLVYDKKRRMQKCSSKSMFTGCFVAGVSGVLARSACGGC